MAIGHLVGLDEHGGGVGIEIGLVAFRGEPHQSIRDDHRVLVQVDGKGTLVRQVANRLQQTCVAATCRAESFSSTRNPRLRASPTAAAVKLSLWQEKQPVLGMKLASVRCRIARLAGTAA